LRDILSAFAILPDSNPDAETGRRTCRNLEDIKMQVLAKAPRRIGYMTKYACIGAVGCLKNWNQAGNEGKTLGIFHGSALGNINETHIVQQQIFKEENQLPSPIRFSMSLSNMSSFNIAVLTGARGPNILISQDELSFEGAMLSSCLAFESQSIEMSLIGGTDCCFGTNRELSNALGLSEETAFGEGTGWLLLGRDSDHSLGEFLDVRMFRFANNEDLSEVFLEEIQKAMDLFKEEQESVFILPGLRIDCAFVEELSNSFPKVHMVHYLEKTGIYPTASAAGIADIINSAHPSGLYLHLAQDKGNQAAIMIFRLNNRNL